MELANIIQSLIALGTLGSLVFIGIQFWKNTKTTKALAYQNMINAIAQFESIIIQNKEVAEIYNKAQLGQDMNDIEEVRFNELCSTWFNYFENFHAQVENKMIKEDVWIGWKTNLVNSVYKNIKMKAWWNDKQALYNKSFKKMVNDELLKMENKKANT